MKCSACNDKGFTFSGNICVCQKNFVIDKIITRLISNFDEQLNITTDDRTSALLNRIQSKLYKRRAGLKEEIIDIARKQKF